LNASCREAILARVLLIHPALGFATSGGVIDSQPQRYVPLGLAYLAGNLIERGHLPELIDLNADNLDASVFLKRIRMFLPDLVGIYTNSFNLKQVRDIVRLLRQAKPECPIVLGGPHVTWRPETLSWAGADYAIRGDGERALVELLENLGPGGDIKKVEGLAHIDGGELVIKPPAIIQDLDGLPIPARHLLPQEEYHVPTETGRMSTLVTARGCPYRCIFCALPNHSNYRARDPELAAGEMLALERAGVSYVDIHDPTFTWKPERVEAFCKTLVTNHSKIRWGCETRADCVDFDLLRLMKNAGCTNVRFGVESGNERVRNEIIGKKLTNDQIKAAVKLSKQAGLETMAFFVLGHPGETLDNMKDSLRFSRQLNATYADFNLAAPIAGSRLFDRLVKDGQLAPNIWEQVADGAPIPFYVPDGVTLSEMIRLRSSGYRQQYLTPAQIIRHLRSVRSPRDFFTKAKAGVKILLTAHRRKDPVIW
jgi:radical SAM superfamily enzyme YgiQ (UPF0313 family)